MDIEKKLNKNDPFKVEMDSERHELDISRRNMLRDMGKSLCPEGLDYMGTTCTHIYARTNMLGTSNEIAFGHMFVGENDGEGLTESCSEDVTMAAMADLVTQVRINYGHAKPKTRNPKDQR